MVNSSRPFDVLSVPATHQVLYDEVNRYQK